MVSKQPGLLVDMLDVGEMTSVKLAPHVVRNGIKMLMFVCAAFVLVCAIEIIICAGSIFKKLNITFYCL